MKTIINELTTMIQVRAEQIESEKKSWIIGKSEKIVYCLNQEIDALNIAIKAIQQKDKPLINQLPVCDRNDFRKWQDEKGRK